jgi:hypothetical protein
MNDNKLDRLTLANIFLLFYPRRLLSLLLPGVNVIKLFTAVIYKFL